MAQKKEKFITPVGEAFWAHVHVPKDPFKDANGKTNGEPKYQIDVAFDPADPAWKPWVDKLRADLQALPIQKDRSGEPLKKQSPIKKELDENDQPTGRLVATFKTGARFKPGVFDRYGQPIPETKLVGNGSKVKVSYTPNAYEGFGGGINFYLNAVQVMELVEYKPSTAQAHGFECETAPASDTNGNNVPAEDNIPW